MDLLMSELFTDIGNYFPISVIISVNREILDKCPFDVPGPLYWYGSTLIPAWMINHMPGKMWDEIAHTFPNSKGDKRYCSRYSSVISFYIIYYGCNFLSMSGLRKSMLAKPSLFLAEVSTDRQQIGCRLASDYQQGGSNWPSISSYTPLLVRRNGHIHASWLYKDLLLSLKCSQYDRKWHVLVRGHRSTANLLSAGYIRVSCGLYEPPADVLWWHLRANTSSLPGQSFEYAQNLSACKSDLHAHLRVSPGEIRVKYWQGRAFCGELRAAKVARLARKGVTGAYQSE